MPYDISQGAQERHKPEQGTPVDMEQQERAADGLELELHGGGEARADYRGGHAAQLDGLLRARAWEVDEPAPNTASRSSVILNIVTPGAGSRSETRATGRQGESVLTTGVALRPRIMRP